MWCHLVIIEIHRRHLLYPGPLLNNLNFSFQIIEDQEKQSGQYSILTNFSPSSQMFSIFHISPKYWSVLAPIKKIWTSKGVVSRMRFNFSFNFFFMKIEHVSQRLEGGCFHSKIYCITDQSQLFSGSRVLYLSSTSQLTINNSHDVPAKLSKHSPGWPGNLVLGVA